MEMTDENCSKSYTEEAIYLTCLTDKMGLPQEDNEGLMAKVKDLYT